MVTNYTERPIAARTELMRDVVNWKYRDKSENGFESMTREEYRLLFAEISKALKTEDYYKSLQEVLLENRASVNVCVHGSHAPSAENPFDEKSVDPMNFLSWFEQYSNGIISTDYSNTFNYKQPTFMSIPIEIVGRIMDELVDLESQLCLRRMCRVTKAMIDDRRPKLKSIECRSYEEGVILSFDRQIQRYWRRHENSCVGYNKWNEEIGTEKAINDLIYFLRHPKLELREFKYWNTFSKDNFNTLITTLLQTNRHKIRVKSLVLNWTPQWKMIELMKLMDPEFLRSIEVDPLRGQHVDFSKFVELEAWQRARICIVPNASIVDLRHFLHFQYFEIGFQQLSVWELKEIRNVSGSRCEKGISGHPDRHLDI
ncbi:hypothetical protein CAEBREN_03956 [Caenorhabditis brenneri]|uniref:DUF38 domain-containing protein n=1 Tax=Caenorhabditis brenneri TaxID=135651 RepID=G0N2W2_CAEBE|nr:hypothetical protein CAEBREN_03956 [Caenorhabditis brenneri]